MNAHSIAIFGCGDFLRLQADSLKSSKTVRVAALYDPDQTRAQKFGKPFDSCVVADPDTIFADKSIDLVALFVPPWVRKGLFLIAADAGKHIIATKLFGSTTADCQEMSAAAARTGIKVGVIYGRTGDPFMEAAKDLFASGRLGRLALYKQDWIHAYPQWNNWATDPEKNGGPFMDAMIHNLNAACYLMDRPVGRTAFFSDRLAHPDLKCADTDMMTKVNKPTPGIFRGMACAAFFLALWTNLPADPHSATSRVFFDDFSYRGPDELEAHGWTVRTKPGWPGIENASWKKGVCSRICG
jgi:predicted dehydrogenase